MQNTFFDGFKDNPEYAIKCLKTAQQAYADCIILCDTNGGTLTNEVERIIKEVKKINKHSPWNTCSQ